MGVTVHEIEYIHDRGVSSVSHPLYALLVSREVDADQSHLNDDGLTIQEREEKRKQKEDEKMQRQVEADLGGFDVEQEWVEEIERENCFEIEKKYGGAPPIASKTYEIWVRQHDNNSFQSITYSISHIKNLLQTFLHSWLMPLIGKW